MNVTVDRIPFNSIPNMWAFDPVIGPFIRDLMRITWQNRIRSGGDSDHVHTPEITGGTIQGITLFGIKSASDYDLRFESAEALTAHRTLTITVNDSDRALTLGGNLSLASALSLVGSGGLSLNIGGATNVTLPTSGTLATLAGSEALTNKTVNGLTITGTTGTLTIAAGSTLSISNSITLSSSGAASVTLPTSGTLATLAGSEALTNKTVNGLTITSTTGTLSIANGSTLATSGANSITLASSGPTSVTLPTSGTLATLAGTETLSNKTLRAVDGAASAPSISFGSDTDTGLFSAGANLLGIGAGGSEIGRVTTNGLLLFTTTDNATDRIQISGSLIATSGIRFNTADNYLANYKEGSWTPVLVGSTTPGSHTYSTQTGSYVRIGKICFARFSFTVSSKDAAMSGSIRITGLPFAAASTSTGSTITEMDDIDFDGMGSMSSQLIVGVDTGQTYVRIRTYPTDGPTIDITQADILTNPSLTGGVIYEIQ